jgi:hypothetical protein
MQGPRCKSPPDQQEIVMSTLPDRPHTALLVIDVQAGVVADTYQRDAVVANIGTLVDTDLEDVLAKAGVGRLVRHRSADRWMHPGHDPWRRWARLRRDARR